MGDGQTRLPLGTFQGLADAHFVRRPQVTPGQIKCKIGVCGLACSLRIPQEGEVLQGKCYPPTPPTFVRPSSPPPFLTVLNNAWHDPILLTHFSRLRKPGRGLSYSGPFHPRQQKSIALWAAIIRSAKSITYEGNRAGLFVGFTVIPHVSGSRHFAGLNCIFDMISGSVTAHGFDSYLGFVINQFPVG
jgi:hypothetical protein